MIKEYFLRLFEDFHQHGKLVKGLNPSFIVLIPKKDEVLCLFDYMPISLIGSIIVIAKVRSTRLSKVFNSIISEQQSVFIRGRQILDSVVVLNQVIEEANGKKCECMIYTIDFSKAYDSVDWGNLRMIMHRFEFDNKWIKWIMECVTSAYVSVLNNGSPTDEFHLERGLRQGDPVSPFLFLVTAEGLRIMIKKAIGGGVFEPFHVGKESIQVSHLQFVDDFYWQSIAGECSIFASFFN